MIVFVDLSATICSKFASELSSLNYALSKKGLPLLNCSIINETFESFMDTSSLAKNGATYSLLSPGNSFGFMYGGFDQCVIDAISDGTTRSPMSACRIIQALVLKKSKSYLPVSTAISVDLASIFRDYRSTLLWKKLHVSNLIYCPTMLVPETLSPDHSSPNMVFDCVWNALNACETADIILPGFGTGTGGIDSSRAVKDMIAAIFLHTVQVEDPLRKSLLLMFYLEKSCKAFGWNDETEQMRQYLTDHGLIKIANGTMVVDSWEELLDCVNL